MCPNIPTKLFKERLKQAQAVLDVYNPVGAFSRTTDRWLSEGDAWSRELFMANEADRVERYRFIVHFRPNTPLVDRVSCDCIA
jgi:hypothetical protein